MSAYVDNDPDGGFNVCDPRDGEPIAWRSDVREANALCAVLSATYPKGSVLPAWDSLVHEVRMDRVGGEAVKPLHRFDPCELRRMIPAGIGGPFDPGLRRPPAEGEVI